MDRRAELSTILPQGVKRIVPSYFQGEDGYGTKDPRFGTYTFDPRDNATKHSAAAKRQERLLDRHGEDGYGSFDPKFRKNF